MKFAKKITSVPYLKDNPQLYHRRVLEAIEEAFYDDCYNMSITI